MGYPVTEDDSQHGQGTGERNRRHQTITTSCHGHPTVGRIIGINILIKGDARPWDHLCLVIAYSTAEESAGTLREPSKLSFDLVLIW